MTNSNTWGHVSKQGNHNKAFLAIPALFFLMPSTVIVWNFWGKGFLQITYEIDPVSSFFLVMGAIALFGAPLLIRESKAIFAQAEDELEVHHTDELPTKD